jgi:hypothetical protein
MTYGQDIDTLLDLDGVIIEQAGGCWTKFEVRRITQPTEEIPHGIRYSFTLHDRHGGRIMGFDNAHAVKSQKKGKYQGRKTYDHRHRHSTDEGIPYEFVNGHQLLKDFWFEVDKILHALGLGDELS